MNACEEAGLTLEVMPESESVRVRPSGELESRPELAAAIRENKADIIRMLRDHELTRLLAAGWTPKVRSEKTIWARPDTGFYCSEEMAVIFAERAAREETGK